ncbi:MAG: saccharopine dehydrogenase C-terminal domain-containing protein, partial [Candidatus Saccharicenans sp.]
IVEYRNGKKEKIISSLIDFGIPYGPTSMSRLVGLPAAIATRLILEGRIKLRGVLIPTYPEIYEPILEELKTLGVSFREEKNFI